MAADPDLLNREIARRAAGGRDHGVEFAPLAGRVVEHLRSGQYAIAAGLVEGALFATPESTRRRSDLAFRLLASDAERAQTMLHALREERFHPHLIAANLATAALITGDLSAAATSAAEMEQFPPEPSTYFLWDIRDHGELSLVEVEDARGHILDLLDRQTADQVS